METTIQIPDGYKVKEVNEYEKVIILEPEISTYYDVCTSLGLDDDTKHMACFCPVSTKEDRIKLETFWQLINVARCLNSHDEEVKPCYEIYYDTEDGSIAICKLDLSCCLHTSSVLFDTRELAQQAIRIIGEERLIKLLKP